MHAFDVFAHRAVYGFAVANIGDVHHDLDEMLHLAAGFLDELAHILHDLVGLLDRIMTVDAHGVVEVLGALPAQPDGLSPCVTTAWARSLSSLCSGYVC